MARTRVSLGRCRNRTNHGPVGYFANVLLVTHIGALLEARKDGGWIPGFARVTARAGVTEAA